jgi:hypothetical protein
MTPSRYPGLRIRIDCLEPYNESIAGTSTLSEATPKLNNYFAPPMPATSIGIIGKYLPLAERVNFCNASKQLGSAFKEIRETIDSQITHFQEILYGIDQQRYQTQIRELEKLKTKKNQPLSYLQYLLDFKICQFALRLLFSYPNEELQKKLASPLLDSQEKTTLLKVKICRLLEIAWQSDAALQCHPEIALLLLLNSNALGRRYLSAELKNDRSFMLKAVSQRGLDIREASREIQDDKVIALAAVKQCGTALTDVSDRLAQDKEVVLAAYAQQPLIFDSSFNLMRAFQKREIFDPSTNKMLILSGLSSDPDVALVATNHRLSRPLHFRLNH